MTQAQWIAAIGALGSAVISLLALLLPGSDFADPTIRNALGVVFMACVPIFVAGYAALKHTQPLITAKVAQMQAVTPVVARPETPSASSGAVPGTPSGMAPVSGKE